MIVHTYRGDLDVDAMETDEKSRTELDSYANMVVARKNCYVIGLTGEIMDVCQFTPEYKLLNKLPLVDAALMYTCEYTNKECLIIVRNELYVPSVDINLIPPFIVRESGVVINYKPKIHVSNPSLDDYAIIFVKENMRILLKLNGIFSYFETTTPIPEQVRNCGEVFLITPDPE